MEASQLKKGMYILQNGEPFVIVKKEVVVYGTHSHSKLKIFLRNMRGGGEKTVNFSHTDKVEALDITRKAAQCISKTDKLQIMDNVSYETFDAEADEELHSMISEGDTVTYIDINGRMIVIEKR